LNAVSGNLTFRGQSGVVERDFVRQLLATATSKRKPASPRRVLLLTLLAGLIFGSINLLLPVDLYLRAVRAAINVHPASKDIVIVKVDDESLKKVGNWPWSRTEHAKLVNNLTRMGARQIMFDLFFAYRADSAGDAAFAKALAQSGRVILPMTAGPKMTNKMSPLPQFAAHAGIADVTLDYQFDTRVRQIGYSSNNAGQKIPSMSAKIAGWKILPNGSFPVDYSLDPRTFATVSAGDVISGRAPANLFAGKIALIGTTTDTLGDQFFLPGYGRMGGVYIHAIGAETLMQGKPVDLGWIPSLLVAAAVGGLAIGRRRPIVQNLILLGGIIVLLVGPTPLEAGLIFFDVGPGLFVVSGLLFQLNWSRLRNRSTINEVSGLPNLIALRADPSARERPLVVARLHNYSEIVSALPTESERQFVEQITSRLCVGATGRKLYHGDEGLFAWFAEPNIPLGHHLEALHALFRSPIKIRGDQYDVMISFGVDIGSGRAPANRLGSALVAADEAESESLKWKYHDPARLADAGWKLSLLSQLDEAIEQGQVWVAYQPKLELATGRVIGVEALARWTHPEKGPISPNEFIGAAEQHDRIEKLTDFILDEAVSAIAAASREGHPPARPDCRLPGAPSPAAGAADARTDRDRRTDRQRAGHRDAQPAPTDRCENFDR